MKKKSSLKPKKHYLKIFLLGPLLSMVGLIVFFGVLEGVLKLVDYGSSPLFYRTDKLEDGTQVIRENRDFAFPYFAKSIIRTPQPFLLSQEKQDNEYRIFMLGSSAAMGDPEASFSIARALEVMLENAYSEVDFEVVNAAMTAINSHVVRRISEDCADLEPDLFVVYEGNNEVIGPFGPSGAVAPFLSREWVVDATVLLRESRIGQFLKNVIPSKQDENLPERWGGMEMFLEQKIAWDDPRLSTVNRHFERNLHKIAQNGIDAGAETLLCTVLVNQKDFSPFQSLHKHGRDEDALNEWEKQMEKGNQAFGVGNLDAALEHYLKAINIDDHYADLNYRIGRLYLELENEEQARFHLKLAVEQDALRFRTTKALNNVVRKVSESIPECTKLVDFDAQIAEASPFNLIGDEWLYEHVHLNFYANFQIARILFEAVSSDLLEQGVIEEMKPNQMEYADVMTALAYNVYEQALIANELLNRFQQPPFTAQSDSNVRLKLWQERVERIQEALDITEVKEKALESYTTAINAKDDWVLRRNYGMALLAFNKYEEAATQLERVHQLLGDDPDVIYALALAYQKLGREGDTKKLFDELEQLVPNYPRLHSISN